MIAVEGIIGSGKTTTAKLLASHTGATLIQEDLTSCPFLEKFYGDSEKYATETEFSFLLIHYHQLRKLQDSTHVVTDFVLAKDLIFAELNLKHRFRSSFSSLYWELSKEVTHPDVCIFLKVEPSLALERILSRGRAFEKGISLDYLAQLEEHYFRMLPGLVNELVTIEVSRHDTTDVVLSRILAVLREMELVEGS